MAGARNDYNVTTPLVELNITKTYHGIAIINQDGQIIGRVQSFTPKAYQRDLTMVYELNPYTFGRPVDIVPGKESGRSISCSRVEVWEEEMEIALGPKEDVARNGNAEWIDLCEQTKPFVIQEALFRGNARYRSWEYLGCWFESKNFSGIEAEGDAKYKVDCELKYVIRRQI